MGYKMDLVFGIVLEGKNHIFSIHAQLLLKPEFGGERCRTCPPLHSHPHKKVMIISGWRNKCGNLIESTWIFSFVA